jgi:hypothetical protein
MHIRYGSERNIETYPILKWKRYWIHSILKWSIYKYMYTLYILYLNEKYRYVLDMEVKEIMMNVWYWYEMDIDAYLILKWNKCYNTGLIRYWCETSIRYGSERNVKTYV